jgi:hypothetical protein
MVKDCLAFDVWLVALHCGRSLKVLQVGLEDASDGAIGLYLFEELSNSSKGT